MHLRDPREQLFGAAERILLQDGPDALTSRSVTVRAGCAKGVLRRRFEWFDVFLAEFVPDRVERMRPQGAALRAAAGTRTVVDNVTDAVMRPFGPLAVSIVALVTFRNQVRVRLREARPAGGVPVLAEIVGILAAYLDAERERGRVAADADVAVLVPTLAGALHLRFAAPDGTPPGAEDVRVIVATVLAGAVAPGRSARAVEARCGRGWARRGQALPCGRAHRRRAPLSPEHRSGRRPEPDLPASRGRAALISRPRSTPPPPY